MYFEPIECTVEEAERLAQNAFEEMQEFDSQIYELQQKLSEIDEYDPQNRDIVKEISDEIFYLSECANTRERWWDYWAQQARWAQARWAKERNLQNNYNNQGYKPNNYGGNYGR